MLDNIKAFIKGALGGIVGCIGFIIAGALFGMNLASTQWLLYWCFAVAFLGGFITYISENGTGLFAMIVFLGLGVCMHIFAIISIVSLFQAREFFDSMAIAAFGLSGILLLRWYKMIGKGDAEGSWLYSFLIVIAGFVVGYLLLEALGEVTSLIISILIDAVCVAIMVKLRVQNGSALDY